jgi:hypothetical protein
MSWNDKDDCSNKLIIESMKKILCALMAIVALSTSGNAQTKSTTSTTSTSTTEEQKIRIEFGRKSKGCAGFGICSLTIEFDTADIIAILNAFKNKDGKLTLRMSPEYYQHNISHFSNGFWSLEEDFPLPLSSAETLRLGSAYTLKRGKYPITFDAGTNTYNCTF